MERLADWISDATAWAKIDAEAAKARELAAIGNSKTDRLEGALRSIANNTCCDGCQEAARVAREALE